MSVLASQVLGCNDPKTFLENVLKTPYPDEEKLADVNESVLFFLENAFFSPFFRPRDLIFDCIGYATGHRYGIISNAILLTPATFSSAVEQLKKPDETTAALEKLKYIYEKIQIFAQKMGLGKVDLYFDPIASEEEGEALSSTGLHLQFILINPLMLNLSSEEVDHVLAHELTHLKKYHPIISRAFSWLVFSLNLVSLRSFSWKYALPIIMITEGIAFLFFQAIAKYCEKEADRNALMTLNSNTGMVRYSFKELMKGYRIKHKKYDELKRDMPDLSRKKLKELKKEYTPFGNHRLKLMHPSTTEQLTMALAFTPRTEQRI